MSLIRIEKCSDCGGAHDVEAEVDRRRFAHPPTLEYRCPSTGATCARPDDTAPAVEVSALERDNERLRKLVADAEWIADERGEWPDCPFCHRSKWADRMVGWPGGHAKDCPAFSSVGVLR